MKLTLVMVDMKWNYRLKKFFYLKFLKAQLTDSKRFKNDKSLSKQYYDIVNEQFSIKNNRACDSWTRDWWTTALITNNLKNSICRISFSESLIRCYLIILFAYRHNYHACTQVHWTPITRTCHRTWIFVRVIGVLELQGSSYRALLYIIWF